MKRRNIRSFRQNILHKLLGLLFRFGIVVTCISLGSCQCAIRRKGVAFADRNAGHDMQVEIRALGELPALPRINQGSNGERNLQDQENSPRE